MRPAITIIAFAVLAGSCSCTHTVSRESASPHLTEDPIKRFTILVLFQAQQDHATELVVAPATKGQPPIRYKIESTWYDMSPPPADILPGVVAEIGRLAAYTKRRTPRDHSQRKA